MTEPTELPVPRLASHADMAELLPHLFGYAPDNSIVVLGFDADRAPQGILRTDLPADPSEWAHVTSELVGTLIDFSAEHGTRPVAIAHFVCPDPKEPGYGADSKLRHAPLARALVAACRHHGLRVIDSLYVTATRWWPNLCVDSDCCPPEGTLLRDHHNPGPITVHATIEGAPTPLRRAVVLADLDPITGPDADIQHEALESALLRMHHKIKSEGHQAVVDDAIALLDATVKALTANPELELDPDQAADLILALQYNPVATVAAQYIEPQEVPAARALWRGLARRCVPAYREFATEPTFLLGFTAWSASDTPTARITLHAAAERGHSLAEELIEAINHGGTFERMLPVIRKARALRTGTPAT